MYKTKKNVPEVYTNLSRDFLLLEKLMDVSVNSSKFTIDGILRSLSVKTCPSDLLPYLQTKIGFITKYNFTEDELRGILLAFPWLVKYKGSKRSIYLAIFLFFRLNNINPNFSIEIVQSNLDELDYDHIVLISFESSPLKTTILDAIFEYILPTGYRVEYVYYTPTSVKVEPVSYEKDFISGFIVGNAIDNQLRSEGFDDIYVGEDKIINDLLSGVDTAVTGQTDEDQDLIPSFLVDPDTRIIKNSWEEISVKSRYNNDPNRFQGLRLGDLKPIHLFPGTIGNSDLGRYTIPEEGLDLYALIIAFDHNAEYEGYGITFLLVKKDTLDDTYKPIGFPGFKMNKTDTNEGGWKTCGCRYSVLGSTDSENNDATDNCAINPVPNTLMSVLPEELRVVMKKIYKYSNIDSVGTKTVDFLPLLGAYELPAPIANGPDESRNCVVYSYFPSVGEPLWKYNVQTDVISAWWLRSLCNATSNPTNRFRVIGITNDNNKAIAPAATSLMVSPIFLV